jgi:transcription antitermination factor NusG
MRNHKKPKIMPTNWYLIFTRSNWEERVIDHLQRRRIESFCPYNQVFSISGNRRKYTYKPLFTSYVFVHINSLRLGELKKVEGVVNLVYWLDKPVVIKDVEIEMMRHFLSEHISVRVEKIFVDLNEKVRFTSDSLEGKNGNETVLDSIYEKLVLPSLGYSLIAEDTTEKVERILQADPVHYNSAQVQSSFNFGV